MDRESINVAISVYAPRKHNLNELARSTFKKGQISRAQGDIANADKCQREAFDMRRSVCPDDDRGLHQIQEVDYDRIIIFWNR